MRALGRQLKLHSNTVSAVYGALVERGWLERRRGSGVYVSYFDLAPKTANADAFARSCLQEGLSCGFSLEILTEAFAKLAHDAVRPSLLVLDTDRQLARILAAEIGEALGREIPFASERELPQMLVSNSCLLITEASLRRLPFVERLQHRIIRLNSMQDFLLGRERPSGPVLIAVVSASGSVRRWASTLLSALGYSADAVLLRDPTQSGWDKGLGACSVVAGDVLAAAELQQGLHRTPVIFRLVSPEFVAEAHSWMKSNESGRGK